MRQCILSPSFNSLKNGKSRAKKASIKKVVKKVSKKKVTKKAKDFKEELATSVATIEKLILTDKSPGRGSIEIWKAYNTSKATIIPGYISLNVKHLADIQEIQDGIRDYYLDERRRRPLNILLQAGPGSGKSHLIKCLAKGLSQENVKAVTFNMTSVEHIDDLAAPLEAVRNLKVNDQLPLLFLDEFDCRDRNFEILLPLLFDGELQLQNRDLRVGKVLIVLAGSTSKVRDTIRKSSDLRESTPEGLGKLVDLLSRINGGILEIPNLDNEGRCADKICITISLLERRFKNLEAVPWHLLSFIGLTRFRYGVRSIEYLLDYITPDDREKRELSRKYI